MDFLNQIAKQVSELFRSMTPGSRITAGLLLALLVVSVMFLFSGKITDSGEYLFGGEAFSATQIQKMEAAFGAEGLSNSTAVPASGGFKIKVKGDKAGYIAALVKHKALPPNCYDTVQEAIDGINIFGSLTAIEASIQNGNTNKLKKMITDMPVIEKAEIMFSKEKTSGFNRQAKSSAAVVVKPVSGETINVNLAKSIQQTAAYALCIPAADITVTDAQTGHCFSGDLGSGEMAQQIQDSEREAKWYERISNLIGIEGMKVAVTVKRDPYKVRQAVIVKPNKTDTVAMSTYEKSNNSETQAPAPGGRPGFKSNMPNQLVSTANAMSTSTNKGSESQSDLVVGGTKEEIVYDTGQEQQVNVSIRIPSEHYVNIWKSRNPTVEGEEPKKPTAAELTAIETNEQAAIKQSVTNQLKKIEGIADPAEFVDVATYQSSPVEPAVAPGMTEKATAWFGKYWTVLGLFGLALLSLRVLRSVMRSVPVEISESSAGKEKQAGKPGETISEEKAKVVASEMLKRFTGTGPSLRDELSVLVNQDADAAATILRGWIGSPTIKA